jgi:hypothetical protein
MLLMCLTMLMSMITPVAFAQDADADADAEGTPTTQQPAASIQMLIRADGQSDGERLTVEAEPGDKKTLKIFLGNMGTEPLSVVTFTSDINSKVNGGLSMNPEGSDQHEPTTWIDYPTETYDLEPETEVSREFELSVPDDAVPGEHVIPIAIETVDAIPVAEGSGLMQKIRKIMVLYVVVPGDANPGFSLGDPTIEYISTGPAIQVPIVNTGQTSLRLTGQLILKDSSGVSVIDESIVMSTFYPGHETIVQYRLRAALPPGEYSLSLDLVDAVNGVENGFKDRPVTMPEPPSTEVVPLEFGNVLVVPNDDPIQFAGVVVEVVNNAQVIRGARLTLIVNKDGELLEEFVIADNVTLEQGVTTISQRYLPITGWESGVYAFSLKLESVDPSSGSTNLLLTSDTVSTIEV